MLIRAAIGLLSRSAMQLLSFLLMLGSSNAGRHSQPIRSLEAIPRVIGGGPVEQNAYPYAQVSLQGASGHYCGGSVVAPDMILSAAHCFPDIDDTVVVGIYNLSLAKLITVEQFRIDEAILHPMYNDGTNEFDVQLLKIGGGDVITVADPVRINGDARVPFWLDNLTATGWGATNLVYLTDDDAFEAQYPDILQKVDLTYVGSTRCKQLYADAATPVKPDMMCAGDEGKSICFGDSGGPLLKFVNDSSKTIQVGITSWLIDCSGDFPGVFHRTSYSFDWIRETICQRSNAPPEYLVCNAPPPSPSPTTEAPSSTPTSAPSELWSGVPTVEVTSTPVQEPALSSTAGTNSGRHSSIFQGSFTSLAMLSLLFVGCYYC